MNSLITICIPTCRRPDLLREALESCFRQDYRALGSSSEMIPAAVPEFRGVLGS
jgi:glycosyltransferase involved in cell wall biosynthesis